MFSVQFWRWVSCWYACLITFSMLNTHLWNIVLICAGRCQWIFGASPFGSRSSAKVVGGNGFSAGITQQRRHADVSSNTSTALRRKWEVVRIYQPPRYELWQSSRGRCKKWWPSTYADFESDSDEEWGDNSIWARPTTEDYCGTALRCSDDEFVTVFDVISTFKVQKHPIVFIVDFKPCPIVSGSHLLVCKSRLCPCELRPQLILTNCNKFTCCGMQETAESNIAVATVKNAWRDHR